MQLWVGGEEEVEMKSYLFHVSFRHVNVSVHPLKVLLRPVGLLAVPLEPPLTLRRGQGKKTSVTHGETRPNKTERKKFDI